MAGPGMVAGGVPSLYGSTPTNPSTYGRGNVGRHNPPIDTLFLSRLDGLEENSLLEFIKKFCPGYKDHKLTNDKKGNMVAFIAFQSTDLATKAKQILDGYQNIQADYSKNSLNQRKEWYN
jgi:hypothetical protein